MGRGRRHGKAVKAELNLESRKAGRAGTSFHEKSSMRKGVLFQAVGWAVSSFSFVPAFLLSD
jgi:hypothetical protein